MLFTYDRVSLCFLNVRRSWTFSRLLNREMHYQLCYNWTYCDVLTLLLHILLEYIIQHTTYLLSCELLSRFLRPMSVYCYTAINHSNCILALGCNPSDIDTTLSHTNWLNGCVVKDSTTCFLFMHLRYLAALEYTFFPLLSASLLPPPVLLVKGSSRIWACLFRRTVAGDGM